MSRYSIKKTNRVRRLVFFEDQTYNIRFEISKKVEMFEFFVTYARKSKS